MKFDVIVGNPPYQLSTGGATAQATPLYDKFVEQAKKLKPRYLTMIIPARWFAGGMGLDAFRSAMLTEKKIRKIVDYPNAKDCFPGVSIGGGVCYFLWDRDYSGDCEFTNINNGTETTLVRKLDEYPVFVRYNEALSVIHKVLEKKEGSLSSLVSALSPFGIGSAERGHETKRNGDVSLWSSKGKGYYPRASVTTGKDYIDTYKVMMSKVTSEHAGEPGKDGRFKVISKMQVLGKEEICTFSYFLVGNFATEEEANNCYSYPLSNCRTLASGGLLRPPGAQWQTMRFLSLIVESLSEQALPARLSLSRSKKRKICRKSDIGSRFFQSCLYIRESLLYTHRGTECIPEGFHKYRFPIVIATSISKKSSLSQIEVVSLNWTRRG